MKVVKIPIEVYEKYFNGSKADAAAEIIAQALVAWFEGKEAGVV